ncbi:MAG: hypothetical protein PHQ27_07180, partial [Victivallales bacterium]|nr:hypothetical protein [Victivallales bacterium]
MAQTTGNLKHYRRKRFFYRFFLRRSAVNAAWFGITWCCFCSLVFAFILPFTLPLIMVNALAMIPAVLVLVLYVYGTLVVSWAYGGMVRSCTSSSWWRNLAEAVGFFCPLGGGIVLVPLMIRRKCWWGMILSIISLVLVLSAWWG